MSDSWKVIAALSPFILILLVAFCGWLYESYTTWKWHRDGKDVWQGLICPWCGAKNSYMMGYSYCTECNGPGWAGTSVQAATREQVEAFYAMYPGMRDFGKKETQE